MIMPEPEGSANQPVTPMAAWNDSMPDRRRPTGETQNERRERQRRQRQEWEGEDRRREDRRTDD
jgi:hypothetical protein